MSNRSIMYIGSKELRQDRVNPGYLTRVWHGTGAVVTGISEPQAAALCRHPDEYVDVTDLDAQQLAARAAQAKQDVIEARRRALNHGTTPQGRLMDYASDEELEAELLRRRKAKLDALGQPAQSMQDDTKRVDPNQGAKRNAPQLAERVAQAIEEIATRGNADDLDDGGVPKRAAVEAIIGMTLTEDEYREALGDTASL